ncbi:MAG: hypothetical protein ACPHY8_05980, partial [Patescibacteria group bacterium]
SIIFIHFSLRVFCKTAWKSSFFSTLYPLAPKLSASFTKSGFPKSRPKSSKWAQACFHLIIP